MLAPPVSAVAPTTPPTSRPIGENTEHPPLCVDLDGTLVHSDLLLECLIRLIKHNPLNVLYLIVWAIRGRAALKHEVATRVTLDPGSLPYNREFLGWLELQHINGRKLWLCTAANERLAANVANHLGFFQGFLASDPCTNLSGRAKAARLVERFGDRSFDYCGNERRDIAIWKHARGAIVVDGSSRLERNAAQHASILGRFPRRTTPLHAMLRAIRPQQWVKNVLVLVPLFSAHQAADVGNLAIALLATAAFCLCASSVYVLNDLLDLEADRAHPRKSKRPFASGELPLHLGFILAPALLGAALTLAAFLPVRFLFALVIYYAMTLLYSFALKKIALIDTITLAGLYTLRIVAGALAVNVTLSFWMLLFSMFLFLSLAFVKRFAELDALRRRLQLQAAGRGYDVDDLPSLQSLGTSAGYLSVLVLALYVNSPDVESLYSRPSVLWALCIILICWISRVWMKAQRGEMSDDPIVFALKDRFSVALLLLAGIVAVLAI